MKRGVRIFLSFLAAAAFLYLFFRKLDFALILEHMKEANPAWLLVAVFMQAIHLTLRSLRWRLLLSPMKPRIGFYNLFATTAIGYLLSFLFFRIGEVLRPMMLGRREGISLSGAFATCVLERLMDALSVALLFAVYLIFLFEPTAAGTGALNMTQMRQGGIIFGVAALACFPVLFLIVHYRQRVFAALEKRAGGKRSALVSLVHSFLGGFDAVKGGWLFTLAWIQSIAIWVVVTISIWASLKAFDLSIGMGDCLLMLALLNIGIAVPTPGAVGSYEYMGQLGLVGAFGVEQNRAAATILVTHAVAIMPVMITGAILLWREGMTLASLSRITREAEMKDGAGAQQ